MRGEEEVCDVIPQSNTCTMYINDDNLSITEHVKGCNIHLVTKSSGIDCSDPYSTSMFVRVRREGRKCNYTYNTQAGPIALHYRSTSKLTLQSVP